MEGFDYQGEHHDPSAFDNQEGYDDAPAFNIREGYSRETASAYDSRDEYGRETASAYDSREGYSREDALVFDEQRGAENSEEYNASEAAGSQTQQSVVEEYSYGGCGQADTQNTYGDGDETNGWYRPYEEPEKPRQEKSGFGRKIVKFAALALTFGIVAGTAFAGTTRFFGKVTGSQNSPEQEIQVLSGGDFNIAEGTETADQLSDSSQNHNKAQARQNHFRLRITNLIV